MPDTTEAKLKFDPVQVRVKGFAVRGFLAERFLESLTHEFPDAKFITVRFVLPVNAQKKSPESASSTDKFELVTLGHYAREHADEDLLTIDCDSPETLKRMERVLQHLSEA